VKGRHWRWQVTQQGGFNQHLCRCKRQGVDKIDRIFLHGCNVKIHQYRPCYTVTPGDKDFDADELLPQCAGWDPWSPGIDYLQSMNVASLSGDPEPACNRKDIIYDQVRMPAYDARQSCLKTGLEYGCIQ
jgi:hypothetical protein